MYLEVWCVQEHEAAASARRTMMLWVIVSPVMLRCSSLAVVALLLLGKEFESGVVELLALMST